jgi:hypothetical protein
MSPLLPLLITFASAAGPGHEAINPVYRELRKAGVPLGGKRMAPLPAPTMPDGLGAGAQLEIIKRLGGEDYPADELMRKSAVAPHILRLRDVKPSDPKAPGRGVDVWFVAYGDLDRVADRDFLDRLLESNRKEGKARTLTRADLSGRGIKISPKEEKYESYGHVVFTFLDRVQISATARSYWSRTADSVLVAVRLDPRFVGDREFPNSWRSLSRKGGGKPRPAGPAHPYDGAGYYVKITRLAKPPGALFVEAHVVFTESVGWFEGANLLRSKLPPVVQSQVRSMRRELLKAGK